MPFDVVPPPGSPPGPIKLGSLALQAADQADIRGGRAVNLREFMAHKGEIKDLTSAAAAIDDLSVGELAVAGDTVLDGRLGVGVASVEENWSGAAGEATVRLGSLAAAGWYNDLGLAISENLLWDGSDARYLEAAAATRYLQVGGEHKFQYAAAGANPGDVATLVDALTLSSAGASFGGVLLAPDGSAAAPSYSFSSTGNSDNGMYLAAANEIGFAAAGSERVRINASGLDITGSLDFTGTARRITGDFSNSTIGDRVIVQTSEVNANTVFGVMPNGTGNASKLNFWNSSDPDNSSEAAFGVTSSSVEFASSTRGTGTLMPMRFYVGGFDLLTLHTSRNVGVGAATFGTSAINVFSIKNGTAPTTGATDCVQFYSSDDAAGHTIPSFYCEGTNVVATGQADSASSVRVKMRINGTVRTFLCI